MHPEPHEVSGHDFSRAEKSPKKRTRASAPAKQCIQSRTKCQGTPLHLAKKGIRTRTKCQSTTLQLAQKCIQSRTKCQGTTSVVPKRSPKRTRASAPAEQCIQSRTKRQSTTLQLAQKCIQSRTKCQGRVAHPFSAKKAGAPSFRAFCGRVGKHEPQLSHSPPTTEPVCPRSRF